MKRVVFVTTEDARYGFSLAGMVQQSVEPSQAEPTLRQLVADASVAVVVMDERLLRRIPEKRLRELETDWRGLLVTLPAPSGTEEGEDRLQRLIRRALGYHVRLQL